MCGSRSVFFNFNKKTFGTLVITSENVAPTPNKIVAMWNTWYVLALVCATVVGTVHWHTEARRAELRRILHQYMPLEEDNGTVMV